MKELDESQLVGKMRQGDEKALAELIDRHQSAVARVVNSMLGYVPEADDICQEVFLRFWYSIDKYRHEAEVKTFLTRIAINLSINELNRRKRKMSFILSQLSVQTESNQIKVESSEKAFGDAQLVASALNQLDPPHRSVVVLRLVEGYSTKETAEILGLPIGTVLSRLARAQEKMRKIIAKLLKS
ncbi:MAG: RNA polymerase sigma factor [Bacteroidales bacterium]|nr:RNA polymerase sigma factor [Bacteroidales bacterium]